MLIRSLVVSLLLAAPLLAQTPPAGQNHAVPPQAAAPAQSPVFTKFDLDFKGGTIAEYAAAVRAANPDVSVVVAPEAAGLAVPAIELRGVTSTAAIRLLETFFIGTPERETIVRVQAVPLGTGDDAILAVGAHVPARAEARAEYNVWTLGPILDAGAKVEDVLAAVEVAHQAVGPGAVIKYHPATRILIAKGTGDHIALIDRVINRIGVDAFGRPREQPAP